MGAKPDPKAKGGAKTPAKAPPPKKKEGGGRVNQKRQSLQKLGLFLRDKLFYK